MLVKNNARQLKQELSEGLHVASVITMCVVMTLIMLVLGTFITDRYKTIVVPKDLYFPQYTIVTKTHSSSIWFCQKSSPSSLGRVVEFTDSNGLVDLWHSMNDEELMEKAMRVPHVAGYPGKLAFMFLTRGSLPLGLFWEKFFKGHEGLYSIYLHTSPDFDYEPPNTSVFYKRRIPSKHVQWGKPSMIDAERRLLANALLDLHNQRFILVSETCIPLFNFTTIYNYLMKANQSFLNSFDDPRKIGRGRYNKRMSPTITLQDWRKGSQWFEVNRQLGIEIISDKMYYNIFRNHCLPPCYMDEHYLPTLVNKVRPDLTTNTTMTWTDWSGGGSHPATFRKNDITEAFLHHVRYDESNCTYNGGNSSICFLFARKFHPSTLEPLLKFASGLFGFSS
ncbi:Glycosyl transferase, family 14 [Artemisia annua]|uniref:Glycosyl transferase, family 14 n=1 Tax=Artemisia annua TaxID=35608 RepID=A0A2U1MDF6_ARTAN|nr:Glycosyl transferase, family 14 [Artemisia annua]